MQFLILWPPAKFLYCQFFQEIKYRNADQASRFFVFGSYQAGFGGGAVFGFRMLLENSIKATKTIKMKAPAMAPIGHEDLSNPKPIPEPKAIRIIPQ